MPTRSSRVGFTMVELLVVIAIVAVLISILLPALNKVRRQAMIVSELSNMRQVGLAVTMYANDNKGRLPGGSGNDWSGYPYAHDIVRGRLFGYYKDIMTGQYVQGGPVYLQPSIDLNAIPGTFANGPSSPVWGCPMTGDSPGWHRYGTSWWWNAGRVNTCDSAGQPIWCTPNFTGNWWDQPAWPGLANDYLMTISGGGYTDNQGRQPNPDDIVLITDAGGPLDPTHGPFQGHLKLSPTWFGDVDGTCTLLLSGRAMWRTPKEMQYINVGYGGAYGGWLVPR